MGRYFALTLSMPAARVKNKKSATKSIIMPKINWGYFLLAMLALFGVLYLFQVSSLSTRGYEMRKLEKQAQELEAHMKQLQLEAAEQKSIQNIEAGVRTLNMIPSGRVEYVSGGSDLSYQQ